MADLLDWARDRPLLTPNEAAWALELDRATLRQKLSRLASWGEIHRI